MVDCGLGLWRVSALVLGSDCGGFNGGFDEGFDFVVSFG